jgi:hypothetical protein
MMFLKYLIVPSFTHFAISIALSVYLFMFTQVIINRAEHGIFDEDKDYREFFYFGIFF